MRLKVQGSEGRRRVLDSTPIGAKLVMRLKDGPQFAEAPGKRDVVFNGRSGSRYSFSPVDFEYLARTYSNSEIDSCHRIY